MAYVTPALLRQYAGIASDADDALLYLLIARAQKAIEEYVGFSFEASADSTRYFDAAPVGEGGDVDGRTLVLDTWLYSITTLTNGDATAIASTKYVFEPRNGAPYWGITLLRSSGYTWEAQTDDDTENAITIVGKWAYSLTAPADVQHACLRLALWYYRQRDNSTDVDRPVLAEGIMIMPAALPRDILDTLEHYKWRGAHR